MSSSIAILFGMRIILRGAPVRRSWYMRAVILRASCCIRRQTTRYTCRKARRARSRYWIAGSPAMSAGCGGMCVRSRYSAVIPIITVFRCKTTPLRVRCDWRISQIFLRHSRWVTSIISGTCCEVRMIGIRRAAKADGVLWPDSMADPVGAGRGQDRAG